MSRAPPLLYVGLRTRDATEFAWTTSGLERDGGQTRRCGRPPLLRSQHLFPLLLHLRRHREGRHGVLSSPAFLCGGHEFAERFAPELLAGAMKARTTSPQSCSRRRKTSFGRRSRVCSELTMWKRIRYIPCLRPMSRACHGVLPGDQRILFLVRLHQSGPFCCGAAE